MIPRAGTSVLVEAESKEGHPYFVIESTCRRCLHVQRTLLPPRYDDEPVGPMLVSCGGCKFPLEVNDVIVDLPWLLKHEHTPRRRRYI